MDSVKPHQPVYAKAQRKARSASAKRKPALRIYKLDLPVKDSTAKAWQLIDQKALPALTRTVWGANGLRLGLMPSQRLSKLRDALPRITAVSQAKVYATDQYLPIVGAPRLPQPIRVDLTVPPHPVKEKVVRSGRMKLLLRAERGRGGHSVIVELTPHQYIAKLSLKPRPAREKVLDGHTFKPLSMSVALASNQMLVIGLQRPWDEPPPSQQPSNKTNAKAQVSTNFSTKEKASTQATATAASAPTHSPKAAVPTGNPNDKNHSDQHSAQQSGQPNQPKTDNQSSEGKQDTQDKNALPPIGHNLGRALFTLRRATHPLQTILIIRVAAEH